MSVRKRIGHVLFRIDSGAIQAVEVDLLRDPESVRRLASEIIERQRLEDRFANPEDPAYDPEHANTYAEMLDSADKLRNVALSGDDDLIILEVFDDVNLRDP
jgi:hypothetical protein